MWLLQMLLLCGHLNPEKRGNVLDFKYATRKTATMDSVKQELNQNHTDSIETILHYLKSFNRKEKIPTMPPLVPAPLAW